MTPRQALETCLDEEHADAVLDHRKAKRAPLTTRAAQLLAKEFAKCPDANAAADEMLIRGWQGFKAEWVTPKQRQSLPQPNKPRNIAEASTRLLAEMRESQNARIEPGTTGSLFEQDVPYLAAPYGQR